VGALGTLVSLLLFLPYVGWILVLPVFALQSYFWILRGYALSAFHGCPLWKGIGATLLHAALLGLMALLCLGLVVVLFFVQVG
jgi:hypothetical protein